MSTVEQDNASIDSNEQDDASIDHNEQDNTSIEITEATVAPHAWTSYMLLPSVDMDRLPGPATSSRCCQPCPARIGSLLWLSSRGR